MGQAGLHVVTPSPDGATPREAKPWKPTEALQPLVRTLLWVGALACTLIIPLLAVTLPHDTPGKLYITFFGLLAAALAASTRLPAAWHRHALTLLWCTLVSTIAGVAAHRGWGLSGPGLPLAGLLVCVLCVACGWRAGVVLAVVSTATLLLLAGMTPAAGAADGSVPPRTLLLAGRLVAVALGLGSGIVLERALHRTLHGQHEREERFRRLLALAADAYWEIDAQCRLVSAADRTGTRRQLTAEQGLGRVPWQLPHFGCDADTLDLLLADIESRRPFRDVPVRWSSPGRRRQLYLASGEPRFDERGIFAGYWGVARDVTEEQTAKQALEAVETRYQDLFSHIPTPLVLHRDGTVIDANPAAVLMFGHAGLADMLGTDLLQHFEAGDSRERGRRRTEQLQTGRPSEGQPVVSYRLAIAGKLLSVRATGVQVDAGGQPAVLSIFVDDTERLASDEAVRRSEALLSHLVATSPDLITLTEMATGRYAMVNQSFERMTGWTAAEAVGRTALELGIWPSSEDRQRFVDTVRETGVAVDQPATFCTRSGLSVSMVVSAARFTMDRREYLVINARDVSERERQRLEREAILTNASIGIAVTQQQRFVQANPHFERIYGWAPGELQGQPGRVVWLNDADYNEVAALAGPALAEGLPVEFERVARRKDGSRFTAHVRGHVIDPARPTEGGTVWIVEDVSQRHEFAQTLARARDAAEAASRAKSAFLANTSHELRTPLNGMIGLARLAQEEGLDETRRRQYLAQIVDSSQALAGIISDILDLSKIEAGKLQLDNTRFDLLALLQAQTLAHGAQAAARGLVLHFNAAPGLAGAVVGDALRVRQVVSNFLSNAIKFTAQGQVVLQARRLGNGLVRIDVQDTGAGLDEATRARLFKPFTQADQSTTRRYGGTGLGLSICHELATLMGGRVGVDSQVGVGSTFWAELPLPASTSPAPPPAPPLALDAGMLRGARVLMVEDNAVNMMIAVALLERWGVQVTQAHDGREAVAAAQRAAAAGQPFVAVLMDVQMPVMSGHEATALLRAQGHRMPIIALTAAALVSERDAALAAGMDDFLTKPVDADKLLATLQRWCTATAQAALEAGTAARG